MPAERRSVHTGLILLIACTAQFMVILDVSIVNVALPSIRTALDFSENNLQWVVSAYTVTFAGFLMLGGRAGDLLGRKRMFIVGVALFSFASLLGALATTSGLLVAARGLQGLGGAIVAPATLSIITTTFAGMFLIAAGALWLSQISATGSWAADVLAPSVVTALGMGMSFVPVTIAAVAGVPPERAGLASGLVNTSRQMGGALGLAVLASLAANLTSRYVDTNGVGALDGEALVHGYSGAFLMCSLFAFAGAVAALILLPRLRPAAATQAPAPEAVAAASVPGDSA